MSTSFASPVHRALAVRALGAADAIVAAGRIRGRRGGRGNRIRTGPRTLMRGLRLDVRGRDNVVVVGADCRLPGVSVTVLGDGNRIVIGDDVRFSGRTTLWLEDDRSELVIGDRCTFEHDCLLAATGGQRLALGADCMIASDVEVRTGDSHPIFALDAPDAAINEDRPVTLGDHVWVGKRSLVLKGVQIADGVIVGAASVVTHTVAEAHSVVAGNPARTVRTAVGWRR